MAHPSTVQRSASRASSSSSTAVRMANTWRGRTVAGWTSARHWVRPPRRETDSAPCPGLWRANPRGVSTMHQRARPPRPRDLRCPPAGGPCRRRRRRSPTADGWARGRQRMHPALAPGAPRAGGCLRIQASRPPRLDGGGAPSRRVALASSAVRAYGRYCSAPSPAPGVVWKPLMHPAWGHIASHANF